MKKIFSLFLTFAVLAALLTVPAMAEETVAVDFEGVGVTLEVPEAFEETQGVLDAGNGYIVSKSLLKSTKEEKDWTYSDEGYISVNDDNTIAILSKSRGEIGGDGGFSHAAFSRSNSITVRHNFLRSGLRCKHITIRQ